MLSVRMNECSKRHTRSSNAVKLKSQRKITALHCTALLCTGMSWAEDTDTSSPPHPPLASCFSPSPPSPMESSGVQRVKEGRDRCLRMGKEEMLVEGVQRRERAAVEVM